MPTVKGRQLELVACPKTCVTCLIEKDHIDVDPQMSSEYRYAHIHKVFIYIFT